MNHAPRHTNEFSYQFDYEHQTVDRFPVLAYISEDTRVEVEAIVVNGDLCDMDLQGYKRDQFQSLEDDVISTLTEGERKHLQTSYFR